MIRKGVIAPADISVSQKIRPLSVGTLTCDPSLCNVDGLDFVQVFFPDDSYEYYRVKTKADATNASSTYAMEHSIVWLEDYVCTEEVSFEGTVAELLTKLLGYATQTKWRLGVVEHDEEVKIDIKYTNVMQGVIDALDLCDGYCYTFDQTGDLWYINLVELPDDVSCEGRLSRNIVNCVINIDYRDFATRLYVPGKVWHVDSESQAVWGLRENVLNAETKDVDDEELVEQCHKYFRDHSEPVISVSVEAHEIGKMTGHTFDWFEPGKNCRLCLMDYNGAVVTERITDRTYPNLLTNPDFVVLTMANKLPDASSAINGLSVTMKTFQTRYETRLYDYHAELEEIDGKLTAQISEVMIDLDAEKARIDLKADQTVVDDVSSTVRNVSLALDAANAEIALMVRKDSVISAINLSTEGALIQAPKINLVGYVTASELAATNAEIANLTAGYTRAGWIRAQNLDASIMADLAAMRLGGDAVTKAYITMGSVSTQAKALSTGGSLDLQHSHAVTVNNDGTVTLGEVSATGGNFNIADTKVYKDGVSAAYEAGWTAAVAMCEVVISGTYGNIITVKMPGTEIDTAAEDDVYTVSSGGALDAIVNRAPNVYSVSGNAYAYIKHNDENRVNVSTTPLYRSTTFS